MKTTHWTRLDVAAEKVGAVLNKSVSNWTEALPTDTQEICSRETDHTSDSDKRDHLTVVCFNSNGDGTTRHVPVTK
ncbi:hypothetical protein G7Y89_g10468 [Cudoniella acicularis]|uniref:Uncharacterized protein n=1 Tax=Cudoniella acicularis TaxID=354080 RepID=A0A8H4VZ05_9HELO|nr:hypothetical protein G7Y89_g10468 [Cudoniella acicularis]